MAHSGAQNSYNFRPHEEIELLRAQVRDKNVFVVLRIKTEKCRESIGWRGRPTVGAVAQRLARWTPERAVRVRALSGVIVSLTGEERGHFD